MGNAHINGGRVLIMIDGEICQVSEWDYRRAAKGTERGIRNKNRVEIIDEGKSLVFSRNEIERIKRLNEERKERDDEREFKRVLRITREEIEEKIMMHPKLNRTRNSRLVREANAAGLSMHRRRISKA